MIFSHGSILSDLEKSLLSGLRKVGPILVPSLKLIIANGEDSSLLNDCWIPGCVISRSVLEINWIGAESSSGLKVFIENGGWNTRRVVEVLGEGVDSLLSQVIFDPSFKKDSYVWSRDCIVRPNTKQVIAEAFPFSGGGSQESCGSSRLLRRLNSSSSNLPLRGSRLVHF